MSSSGKVVASDDREYRIGELIAHGAFSEVYKCYRLVEEHAHRCSEHVWEHEEENNSRNIDNNNAINTISCERNDFVEEENNDNATRTYAIKVVDKELAQQHHMEEALAREVNAMETAGYSPYIIQLIDRFVSSSNYYIVMNYTEGGTLLEFIRSHRHHINWTKTDTTQQQQHHHHHDNNNSNNIKNSVCSTNTTRNKDSNVLHYMCVAVHESESSRYNEPHTLLASSEHSLPACRMSSSPHSASPSQLPLMWEVAPYYLKQLLLGLQHLHARNVVHRDIKPENLLLSKDLSRLMISDFGFACYSPLHQTLRRTCGTLKYCAPELLVPNPRYDGRMVDVWAAGVTLYVMLCFTHPFKPERNDADSLLECIESTELVFPLALSGSAVEVVKMMLTVDPHERATVEELLVHPWLEHVQLEHTDQNFSLRLEAEKRHFNESKDKESKTIVPKEKYSDHAIKLNSKANTSSKSKHMENAKIMDKSEQHSNIVVTLPSGTSTAKEQDDAVERSSVNENNHHDGSVTTMDNSNHHNKNSKSIYHSNNTTNNGSLNSNSSNSSNNSKNEHSISYDSMTSADNGFYCSLHLSQANISDGVSEASLSALHANSVDNNVTDSNQSPLKEVEEQKEEEKYHEENNSEKNFSTTVSVNNYIRSHFPITLSFKETETLHHLAANEYNRTLEPNEENKTYKRKLFGSNGREYACANNHASNKHKIKLTRNNRKTSCSRASRSRRLVHSICSIIFLFVYLQLFCVMHVISFIIQLCFNIRLSELQHPCWFCELVRYSRTPPLDRFNMWMLSRELPLSVLQPHSWEVYRECIEQNKLDVINRSVDQSNMEKKHRKQTLEPISPKKNDNVKDNASWMCYLKQWMSSLINKKDNKKNTHEPLQSKKENYCHSNRENQKGETTITESTRHNLCNGKITSLESSTQTLCTGKLVTSDEVRRQESYNSKSKRSNYNINNKENEKVNGYYNDNNNNNKNNDGNGDCDKEETTTTTRTQLSKEKKCRYANNKWSNNKNNIAVIKSENSSVNDKDSTINVGKCTKNSNGIMYSNEIYSPTVPFPERPSTSISSAAGNEDFPLSNAIVS